MQHSFEEFSEKPRKVELKSVGNFVAKTVLVESANQFLLEGLCRTQYSVVSKSSRQTAVSVKLRAPIGLDRITGKIVIDRSYLLL